VDSPVVVRGLRKQYGNATAVDGLDLEIRAGEVFCMLGPNGAGKTTTVEILEGLRNRSDGDVRVLGHDPARHPRDWRARIGVVPQTTGAFADLTVREVVAQFAAFYPGPLPVDEVIDMVGLTAARSKQSMALSGGQRRRLDVAVGIVGDPELIFLDEPTTGLDPVARREAWEVVRFFAGRGKTTILTTHYLDEAETLSDRVGIIVGGRMIETGRPAEIGGRSHTPARVCFTKSGRLAGLALPSWPEDTTVEVTEVAHGAEVRLGTPKPTAIMAALLPWAHAAGVDEIPDVRIYRPTLEETYLDLIRRHNRDEAGTEGTSP
jgi:ABC-2 type transport system ATP-binding protein